MLQVPFLDDPITSMFVSTFATLRQAKTLIYYCRGFFQVKKGRYLAQSYDKSPCTDRKIQKAQKRHQKLRLHNVCGPTYDGQLGFFNIHCTLTFFKTHSFIFLGSIIDENTKLAYITTIFKMNELFSDRCSKSFERNKHWKLLTTIAEIFCSACCNQREENRENCRLIFCINGNNPCTATTNTWLRLIKEKDFSSYCNIRISPGNYAQCIRT